MKFSQLRGVTQKPCTSTMVFGADASVMAVKVGWLTGCPTRRSMAGTTGRHGTWHRSRAAALTKRTVFDYAVLLMQLPLSANAGTGALEQVHDAKSARPEPQVRQVQPVALY